MVRPADAATAATRWWSCARSQREFPLYGTLTLADGRRTRTTCCEGHGALVRPELLAQLDLQVGDAILIGTQPFEIRGVIKDEPGRSLGAFSLGPRVIIDYADLAVDRPAVVRQPRVTISSCCGFPSRRVEPVIDALRTAFANEFVARRAATGRAQIGSART